jgi:Tfp pilus assembly protein PilV
MDYRQKEALIKELILETFRRLRAILEKYDIQIFNTYNVNKIGFRVDCIASSTVITFKNVKEVSPRSCILS